MNSRRATWVPRRQCLAALGRVLLQGESLTQALADETAHLPPREAAWARALAFATVRWHVQLDAMVEGMLDRPLKPRDAVIRVLLCQGLAEVFHFGTPDHAAVRETAELARTIQRPGAVGLVNALLRRALREREPLLQAMQRTPALRYACPAWLVAGIRASHPEHWEAMLEASTRAAPMTLRVNTARVSRAAMQEQLHREGLAVHPHPLVPTALTLADPMDVDAIPGFADGLLSVQDAAAQWAGLLLSPQPGERILDACAAPGGKTGHLLEASSGQIDLTALDVDGERMGRVRDNLQRLEYRARMVIGDLADPQAWWDGRPFDAILLDVPCSASGVIRRHPDIKLLRRAADIPALATRQRELLAQAWELLRPGGRLLYVTCSLLAEENERVVGPWLAATPDAQPLPLAFPGGVERAVGRAVVLGTEDMDGFYYALLGRAG
ncbi:16S rRNA (cytosine(967)-C(5))-methyltransferase RsmB [Thioalkalivibrio paradoxus]|uniref:16S rRNA (cytosine(967)-C(5))-methyltransferase n=1 Tax=Thioalkalivibrio paradoxus ARh 1 TaxID=713585 RepID=W0DR40_9GAMM|nr:16S rRNA (cytosine(967)-C(5))-methyltransferase RsmB [Thioalkalivibrio paradoxus]AHE99463.1 16S rRNA methyltransferase [Thioalkalivibrio paradoxus ARh 1]